MQDPSHEWVLLVPPQLAQSSYALLKEAHCVARPWHFEGRFGSRTHKDIKSGKIGIPVISKVCVETQANDSTELQALLRDPDVELVWKDFTPSNRAIRKLPHYDARIHPERAPDREVDVRTSAASKPSNSNKHNHDNNNKPRFTYVDLFAGLGGFAVALDALGGNCVLASEIDEACQRVYRHNFPTAPLHGDIYQIGRDDNLAGQPVDLLVGGFPCQPFSALGQQPGLSCDKGNLFLEIVRLLRQWHPKAFLLENVPGLLAMEDTFGTILTALQDAGYQVTHEVCNARGVTATSRKRLFLVGILKDTSHGNAHEKGSPTGSASAATTTATAITTTIEEAAAAAATTTTTTTIATTAEEVVPFEFPFVPDLQLKASDVLDYANHELSAMERQVLPLLADQLQVLNQSKRWKPADLAWPNTVCDTLVSHYGNSITRGESQLVPCSAAAATNNHPRRFSPRECLRIMGFPNAYQLPARPDDSTQGDMAFCKEQYRMAGNAVCPPLMAALAGAVLDRVLTVSPPTSSTASNWVDWGRQVAVDLAYQATRTGRPTADVGSSSDNKQGTKRDFETIT